MKARNLFPWLLWLFAMGIGSRASAGEADEVTQEARLSDIRTRADLALSAMQLRRETGAVTGIVDNAASPPRWLLR